MTQKHIALLLLIAVAAILVHGYHPAVEDGELYLPGIKKDLNPALYPFNDQFFMSHARMTLFDELVAFTVRISHLPFDYVILVWHIACVFLFLLGCWRVAHICFRSDLAAWGGVGLVASMLTIPVAGTALYIMDQYLTPRDLSTAGIMLVLPEALRGRLWRAVIGMLLIALIHPLMCVFGFTLLAFLYFQERRLAAMAGKVNSAVAVMLLLPLPFLASPSNIYRHLLRTNDSYFLVLRWPWYEWAGIVVPFLLLWWMAHYGKSHGLRQVEALSRSLVIFGAVFFVAALLLCIPRLAGLALLQPMRCLHLIFILLFVMLGGVLAESVLKSQLWRWFAVFVPLCLLMFLVQRQLFPASEHLELSGRASGNRWVQAFQWARSHTPRNAVFALDPDYMNLPGEDEHGFRAIAERSTLATIHDNGGVSMFPALAQNWYAQLQAQQGWRSFHLQDFRRLQSQYGATWVVLQNREVPGLSCPYSNDTVMVCRLD
ncbi:MAG TPA: hypothetical protein VL240_03005 [Candidatus Binatia bacterium]|nr:hypothetical protein [Candidatus Binatia bacterium]